MDLDRLRELAEAATPGPWEAIIFDSGHSKFEFEASVCTQDVGDSICRMDGLLRTADNERYRTDGSLDALYIAAVSPDVVLGLLDRLDKAERIADLAREYAQTALAAVLPELLARAWDEGAKDACADPRHPYGECEPPHVNPYRERSS